MDFIIATCKTSQISHTVHKINRLTIQKQGTWSRNMFPSRQDHGLAYLPSNFILQLCGHIWSMLAKFGTPPYYLSRSVHCLSFVRPHAHTNKYFYSFFPHTVSLWNNLPYDVVSTVPFSTIKCRILDVCQSQPRAIHAFLACIVYMAKTFQKKKTKKKT